MCKEEGARMGHPDLVTECRLLTEGIERSHGEIGSILFSGDGSSESDDGTGTLFAAQRP